MGSSNPELEVSVSFGRFENDSLSWEKWSTFSPNKYLEDVEKCATPGSVAQKKAFFEEHYKKIAARKAELLAQDKPMETSSHYHNAGDLVHQCSDEEYKQESNLVNEEEPQIATPCQNSWVEELKQKIDSTVQSEEKQEIMGSIMESPGLNKPEETAPEEEMETLSKGSQDVKELSHRSENVIENTPEIKVKNLKLGQSAKSHKITAANKERNDSRIKKKHTSAVTKTSQVSTTRTSKQTLTPTTTSASRTRPKTGTTLSYSSPKTKNLSVEQSKKLAPRSLHMSISLGPSSSGPSLLSATRKSLIMEKMGDKEIVKRAFKTFQSNYNQLKPSSQEQSPAAKPVPTKGRESRVSTLTIPQKENGGSSKVSSMEKKNAKAAPSYSGLKSDERPVRRKELPKKLEGKSNEREAERKNLQTKSKDNKDAEIKKLRQSLNFKATPLPGFYHGQRTSKSPLDKIGSKSDIHRQPGFLG